MRGNDLCLPPTLASWYASIETTDTLSPCRVDPVPDRDVLVALFNATDGANWVRNSNWLSERPISEWHGVTTDSAGRVTRLNLARNGLAGTLPPGIG